MHFQFCIRLFEENKTDAEFEFQANKSLEGLHFQLRDNGNISTKVK